MGCSKGSDNMAPKKNKEISKIELIEAERKKLSDIYSKIAADTKKTVDKLINNAAFMAVTLEELQSIINEKGCIEEYQNGANQKGYKKSSEVEVYNTMIKNYSGIIRQLTDLLPDPKQSNINNAGEKLAAFVARGKPGGGN